MFCDTESNPLPRNTITANRATFFPTHPTNTHGRGREKEGRQENKKRKRVLVIEVPEKIWCGWGLFKLKSCCNIQN